MNIIKIKKNEKEDKDQEVLVSTDAILSFEHIFRQQYSELFLFNENYKQSDEQK